MNITKHEFKTGILTIIGEYTSTDGKTYFKRTYEYPRVFEKKIKNYVSIKEKELINALIEDIYQIKNI